MRMGVLLLVSLLSLSACGVRRPLIAPKDIPAYEEQRRKHNERYREILQPADPAPERMKAN